FLLLISSAFSSHNIEKRSNAYGDELIVPEEVNVEVQAEPKASYAEEESAVVAAEPVTSYDEPTRANVEEVERSGYRFKRSNAYGDELIVPEESSAAEAVEEVHAVEKPSYGEEEVAVVHSEPYGEVVQTHPTLNVQESGYRLRRNVREKRGNEYGDEQIIPEVTVVDESARSSQYAETAPIVAEVQQYESAPAAAAAVEQIVEQSGYRQKRNAYGDELIVPTTIVKASPLLGAAEVAAEVVDQSYVGGIVAARPAISPITPQYTLAKASSYGDEVIVPEQVPVVPIRHLRYAEVPLTYGSLFASQQYANTPIVLSAGYRNRAAKRARVVRRKLH
ncbi:hypothetical protein PFISCL1PPCAC_15138, partial [Pristionchus fissidentatus]